MNFDQEMIERCLVLAEKGRGFASPNPMVGSVVTHNNKIIGEGFHQKFGGPHAEVNAINSVKDMSLLKESTVYVNLEPCAHFGKTPPCADLLVNSGVKRVVIGCIDSFSEVSGKGIEKIKNAGIDITVGVLENKCLDFNKRFFLFHREKRPFIILKWAESKDGLLSPANQEKGKPLWMTGKESKTLVHRWRTEEDAIMVGTNTAIMDNPSLTARLWKGRNPLRVVIDRELKIPKEASLLDGQVKTLVFTEKKRDSEENVDFVKVSSVQLKDLLTELYKRGVQSLIVEGGKRLLESFISEGIWDEARIFVAPISLNTGVKAPSLGEESLSQQVIGADTLSIYKRS
ncbi:bifunctional diaminohydroxyphosphoribosylaminopyrimidine deaminase/5-amino-6-(5-phosphoribosylamino)uracil reductase RibD [Bacteriovoracales bacterium]|nr:bifunctional diaminohydroxyphosphoribosylaminopyrimidine deaminase/5-amino-6-(5-phosphoribosylamino)uracil reductase RibD [Bacteriovoracales bacterium]